MIAFSIVLQGLMDLPLPVSCSDISRHESLGQRMQYHVPRGLNQLFEILQEEWNSIPQEDLDRLISSMPRRVGVVIKKRGGHTQY